MGFRTKVFINIFLSVMLIVGCLYGVANYWSFRFHLRHSLHHAQELGTLLAHESTNLILTNDRVSLLNLYQTILKSHPNIEYIFAERDKEVIVHTFRKGVPGGLLKFEDIPAGSKFTMNSIENEHNELIYHFRVKPDTPNHTVIHLGISAQKIKDELIPLRRLMFFVGGSLLILFPFGLAWFLARIISRPIDTLRKGSERIGAGELTYRLDIKTGDEIERLAGAFNNMAERLQEYYATLEERVAERTEELEQEIEERERAEEEREKTIVELQKALAEVKTLGGLLPICCHCKKIRDDKGYWNKLEVYLHEHSGADFSHSICPECMKRLYPEDSEENGDMGEKLPP
ncbi:MAG: HAMP domain-containing protein [Thermodesulfobacteriota bacterium]